MINNAPVTTVNIPENSDGKINSTLIKLHFRDSQNVPYSQQTLIAIHIQFDAASNKLKC